MAGFDDIARRAKDFVNSEKVQKALKSDKAEQVGDRVLDGVAGFANKVTGGKHEDKIADARKAADEKLGRGGDDRGGDIGPDGTRRPR